LRDGFGSIIEQFKNFFESTPSGGGFKLD